MHKYKKSDGDIFLMTFKFRGIVMPNIMPTYLYLFIYHLNFLQKILCFYMIDHETLIISGLVL